jgi:hypothetical protein
MGMLRGCELCGTTFTPRREHARFCSADCRIAWNRDNRADPVADINALTWSITAMQDATDRLAKVTAADHPRAFAVISEAVWWVTIVDATLVRYHPELYDRVLSDQPEGEQALIEQTLGGLRFVRNQMGQDVEHVQFVRSADRRCGGTGGPVAAWAWDQLPGPALESLSPDGREWEISRYRAYQAQLAGHTVGETFSRAIAFLNLAATSATTAAGTSAR